MTDYISREAALDALRKAHNPNTARMAISFVAVNSVPATDVRHVVRGKWRKIGKTGCIFVCSACDKTFPYKTAFCPNCGADMREES
jgi:hypothetical protein